MNRREFLQTSSLASLPLLNSAVAGAQDSVPLNHDVLVCVFQRGGADGLSTLVPHGDGNYYDLRPNLALGESSLIDLDGFFGLHNSLSDLLPAWEEGDLALIHASGLTGESRSHFETQDAMEQGLAAVDTGLTVGWLNRHLALSDPVVAELSPFRAASMTAKVPLALRGEFPALGLAGLSSFGLAAPSVHSAPLRNLMQTLYDQNTALDNQGLQVFDAIDALNEANPQQLTVDNGAQYPTSSLGSQLQNLSQMIKSGLPLEIGWAEIGGWDHHDRQADQLPGLLSDLGQSLAAFRQDMGVERMARVTVVVMTEFGRRAAENASDGTDHGHGGLMMVLGNGINGGIYTDWPGLTQVQLDRGDLAVTTDYRSVLSDVLSGRVGSSMTDQIFAGFGGSTSIGLV